MSEIAVLQSVVVDPMDMILPAPPPDEIDITDANSQEEALQIPLPGMQPEDGFGNRASQARGQQDGKLKHENEVSTDGTLTPDSSDDQPESKAQHILDRGRFTWYDFLAGLISWTYSDAATNSGQALPNNLKDGRMFDLKIDDYPLGFPRLASFQSSNEAFGIFRMFKYPCIRILLQLEVEINNLEEELLKQDKLDPTSELKERRNRVRSTTYGVALDSTEPNLLRELHLKLKEYYDLFASARRVFELQETPTKHYKSVLDWILAKKPLYTGSYDFIWHRDDFVSIAGGSEQGRRSRKQDFFENKLESLTKFRAFKSFLQPTTEGSVTHYENSRFELARKALIMSTAAASILTPVLLLFLLDMTRGLASVILVVSVMMFSCMVLVIADPDTGTLFITIVGYSALLSAILVAVNQDCKIEYSL
ncbi:hypothetical protein B0O99DRAFT_684648 [Bisporella sp. PMI_857]|nr:hypothetical protein B0O99DRAFT_684648 [Bisporella sp. PMI_857]